MEENEERYKHLLEGKVSQVRMTPMMKEELLQATPCYECQMPCYEYYIKGLEISPTVTRPSKSFAYCSMKCLEKDSRYKTTNLYYYSKFE